MAYKKEPLSGPTIIISSHKKGELRDRPLQKQEISMPQALVTYLFNNIEFDWVMESNETLIEFANLNPHFKPENRIKYKLDELLKIPLKNRGGWDFSQRDGVRKQK